MEYQWTVAINFNVERWLKVYYMQNIVKIIIYNIEQKKNVLASNTGMMEI